MVEKFQHWSDCGGDVESCFTKDELLTNVMLYWATGTIGTSFHAVLRLTMRAPALRSTKEAAKNLIGSKSMPTGFAIFPKDMASPPREWAERFFATSWTEMPRGGHFAAMEEPELLAQDIREFFRPLRERGQS